MADMEAQINNTLVSDLSAIVNKTDRGVILKFEDVVYKIKSRKMYRSNTEKKHILKGVTGIVLPGEMLAMLGPSGSGKTTLLTLLGGRIESNSITGSITYNSKPFSSSIKRNTGFVTQDDVLYEHLTVSETLIFTSLLRLPNSLTKKQKISKVEEVIEELGLGKCRNSIIGGVLERGISGGERKRVSIGQEMLISPSLLFLDEPTSGLDSSTAQKIVSMLWGFANDGNRTIVLTIHQPSSLLFYMFHKVLLLSEGSPLYFGKAGEAMEYFSSNGFTPSIPMNPSDFLLDLANGVSSGKQEKEVKHGLVRAYKATLENKLKKELEDYEMEERELVVQDGQWCTTWWEQFWVLLIRGVKERKHENFTGVKIIQVFVVAFLCGFLWWHSDISRIQDQVGLLFFCAGFWGFFPLFEAIFTFPPERTVLEKERASGMYRLSSYFMARSIGDLPMELALPTAFTIIVYWMSGLKPSSVNFFQTLGVLLYAVLVAHGMGLAIGAMVMDMKSATTLASVLMLSFLLASGYYVQHIPPFISWIKYVSITQYSFKLFLGAQYKAHGRYPCGPNGLLCNVEDVPAIKVVGLDGWSIPLVVLFVMLVGYRVIAYVALMRVGVPKG